MRRSGQFALARECGEGLDFLGFHHRWVRARRLRHVTFLARWPTRQVMQRARDRIRELPDRKRLLFSVEDIVQDINTFLRGWAGYFRYGNTAHHLDAINDYAARRLVLFVAKRHTRRRAYGWSVLTARSSDRPGLIALSGIVFAPRPNRDWRG